MEVSSLSDVAKLAVQAAQSHNGWMILAVLLVAAVFVLKKFLAPKVPFVGSPAGGALLNVVSSFAGMIISAAAAGTVPALPLVLAALKVSLGSAGGLSLLKNLLLPLLVKVPLLQKLLGGLVPVDAAAVKVQAEAAGAAAVQSADIQNVRDLVNK